MQRTRSTFRYLSSHSYSCVKQHFARHGTPNVVVIENEPQFKAVEFHNVHNVACNWVFEYHNSSPYYSQSSGKVEATVKIAKNIVRKATKTAMICRNSFLIGGTPQLLT